MNYYKSILDELTSQNCLRSIPDNGSKGIDLLSNDYLGLASEVKITPDEISSLLDASLFSSSASRLLSRKQAYHNDLEDYLEELYGRPALLFNSGYHANAGIISALARPDTLIISDKLIHASVIDGIKMSSSKGNFHRFPHNNMVALRKIIKKESSSYNKIIIVTEAIFSMDGDLVPLKELVKIKKDFPEVMIYLDEAHSFGVRGEKGLGLAEETELIDQIDLIIGTLGKAAASSGAFVITSPELKSFLINKARSFIFSTALPPINQIWSKLMIQKIVKMQAERLHLKELSRNFASTLREIAPDRIPSHAGESQIIPFLCGSSDRAVAMAEILKEHGFDVLPIRHPTVAKGSERLRFSLNASLNDNDLNPLLDIINNESGFHS